MVAKKKQVSVKSDNQPLAQVSQGEAMMNMIGSAASNPDVDVEKLERLMAMYEKTQLEEKQRVFATAMVATQSEIPVIQKGLENKQTHSFYTDLKEIVRITKDIYTKQGLSLSFGEDDSPLEGHIRIICDVTHINGYSKPYHLDQPLDNAGIQGNLNKTTIHAKASTISYARRYLTGMIFNLAFGEDDDGNASAEPVYELIDDKMATHLLDALEGSTKDLAGVLKYAECKSVAEIQVRKYHNLMEGIKENPLPEMPENEEIKDEK